MSKGITFTAWILLLIAMSAWAAVGFGAYMMIQVADNRASDVQQALTQANQRAINERINTLAQNTSEDRATLATMLATELVTIIDTIEATGKAAGVESKVSDASLSGTTNIPGGEPVRSVVFSVQSAGTFTQIMHAAQLYEEMPLLSSVEQIELQRLSTTDPKARPWVMTVRIKVLTSSS